MNSKAVIALGAAVFLLIACVPSVNPWYTLDDIEFEPALLGSWVADDEVWMFERGGNDDAYRLTVSESGKRSTLTATYFSLQGHHFLDIIPDDFDIADDEVGLIEAALFPGHIVMHVADVQPQLKMAFADPDWLEDFLEERPRALRHRNENGNILLTASTRELQRFLLRHVDGGELFSEGDYGDFTRR